MINRLSAMMILLGTMGGCAGENTGARRFGDDSAFLSGQQYTVLLSDRTAQVQVVVAPAYQGRVMTSTAEGVSGPTFGWINYPLIATGRNERHINAYGGEERLSLAPEGGEFGLFFDPGAPLDFEHWQVPGPIDNQPFELREKTLEYVVMRKRFELTNYASTTFHMDVKRTVRLFSSEQGWRELGLKIPMDPKLRMVAYESSNQVTNAGRTAWKKATGVPSARVVSMMNGSPATVVAVPVHDEAGKDNVKFLRGDGSDRNRLEISPRHTKGVIGSYDATLGVMTIVQFMPIEPDGAYVSAGWKVAESAYAGPAAVVQNGATGEVAKQLGPCYQIETYSPALELASGQSRTHVSRTYHLRGPAAALDSVARTVLGLGLSQMQAGTK